MATRKDSSINLARVRSRVVFGFAPWAFLALAYEMPQAAPNPMINYFKPIPIVGKLSNSGWGYKTVGAA